MIDNLAILKKFWERVDSSQMSPGGCWEWKAGIDSSGYGRFYSAGDKAMGAHRFSYMVANELDSLPSEVFVLHRCDNPPCVNPAHLKAGDNDANIKDKQDRGRDSGWTKIPKEQANQLVRLFDVGFSRVFLGKLYGIDRRTVYRIAQKWPR